ncbi:MAG TPA: phosphatase PAP2 family protein [Terriglobales bacterium]|nr:phosphatase PAP2 family protein [Terriglobales bacterium]
MHLPSVSPEQPHSAPEERTISIVLFASFFAAFLMLVLFAWLAGEVLEGDAHAFDVAVRRSVHANASPFLTLLMRGWTHFGDRLVLIVFTATAFVGFWRKGWKRGAAWIAVTMAGVVVFEVTLKLAFQRPRPEAFFGVSPVTYSFPSGHALGSFCFYATVAALIAHRVRESWIRVGLGILAAVIIAGVGFSRIYLGVHYPTDVIAGYAAAAVWVSALISLDRFRAHRRRRKLV